MSEESEKRFHSIMDKLFLSPSRSSSSSLSGQSSRGQKRSSSASSEAPMCRPWDRGDLMRRLATFKSMTWFAKPEAVSALNCARRGWVNVDTDTIACEACGARFLFSTPSAWNRQQVEKAAAVFSLKLDQGHKLLCPWIDNVCNDMLSQFPPTTPPLLAEKFKERFVALLQLSALPVISSSAIECMKSHGFEQLLVSECEIGSADNLRTEYLGEEHDLDSVKKYYQARKLIALCGWEHRVVPYVVDTGCISSSSLEMKNTPNSQNLVASKKDTNVDAQSARTDELTDGNPSYSNGPQCDPNSVVLDCKLCGASVGLWAFRTVPRPMELVRFVGYDELLGAREIVTTPSIEKSQSLQLTIAGGPPPAKQNFKAMISFPVIGRNLRARFCGDSKFSDCEVSNQEIVIAETTRCDTPSKENENHTSLEVDSSKTGNKDGLSNNQTGNLMETEKDCCKDSDGSHVAIEDNTNKVGKDGETGSSSMVLPKSNDVLLNSCTNEVPGEDALLVGHEESLNFPFLFDGDLDFDISDLLCQTTSDARLNDQNNEEVNLQNSVNNELTSVKAGNGKDRKRASSDQAMEFDPIRQHRHFCPWIASVYKAAPGWKQTLSALHRQKGNLPPSENSIIKIDDPITSVRNLFTSPPKKLKRDLLKNLSTQN